MLMCALFTMIFIVYSSFSFKESQKERFTEYTLSYDSLLITPHPFVVKSDSLRLGDLKGSKTLVLFWASWSEKSSQIMTELDVVSERFPELNIIAALVKDVTDSAEEVLLDHDFEYIDGTILFNRIRVPGIPSYFLLDEEGNLVSTNVGFKEGEIKEVAANFMQ